MARKLICCLRILLRSNKVENGKTLETDGAS